MFPPSAIAQVISEPTPKSLDAIRLVQVPVPRPGIPSPAILPTDATPTGLGEEQEMFRPGYSFYFKQKLPARLWFNSVTEVTQRLETNPLFTVNGGKTDYVFRVQPNVTLGYNLLRQTSIYCNYFLIKDVFARNEFLTPPTFQSLAMGLRHDIPIKTKTNVQFDFQVRELWQASHLRQADMLPGATVTHVFGPRLVGFTNLQLQMRSRNIFQGPTREIDPFYTVGGLCRWREWNIVLTNTLVTNFRNKRAIPAQGNVAMIANLEVSRPISKKFPALVAFTRAEPIWNWKSNGAPGLSGFDFRLFGGVRLSLNKPSYYNQFEKLRKQLQTSEKSGPGEQPEKPAPVSELPDNVKENI